MNIILNQAKNQGERKNNLSLFSKDPSIHPSPPLPSKKKRDLGLYKVSYSDLGIMIEYSGMNRFFRIMMELIPNVKS